MAITGPSRNSAATNQTATVSEAFCIALCNMHSDRDDTSGVSSFRSR